MYSMSTLRRKARQAGYSFEKGYQRWLPRGWGLVYDCNGDKTVGYQIRDIYINYLVWPSCTEMYDHALDLDEAVELLEKLCAEKGVKF